MKFKQKPINKEPKKRNSHRRAKVAFGTFIFLFLVAFFGLFAYLVSEYLATHTFTWQSPVQSPVIIKRIEIVSPVSTTSAGLNVAYAEEYKNPFDPKSPKGIAWEAVQEKWGIQEWGYFEELITRESGWNPYAINQSSGACGLGQSLPCSKMGVELWDYDGQIQWIVSYVENRYGDPASALSFWDEHGWY